jgi:hypothetical protein
MWKTQQLVGISLNTPICSVVPDGSVTTVHLAARQNF